jgi:hypothetical protein
MVKREPHRTIAPDTYDPAIGRFTTEDPLRFGADGNFYRYAANDSTTRTDPFGLQGNNNNNDGWFWGSLNWLAHKLLDPPLAKPGVPQPAPLNFCETGDTRLFYEEGPNPYANNGKYYADWVAFTKQFVHRCEAAKKPGKYTYSTCRNVANFMGSSNFCTCCEGCSDKKK